MEHRAPRTLAGKTAVREIHRAMREKYQDRPEICFLLQDWEDGYNVGSMFRLAEAVDAQMLIGTGRTPQPEANPMIAVTSMGQHRRIPFRYIKGHAEAADQLVKEGWTLIALEIASGAVEISEYKFPDKTCLVLGNEGAGIYSAVMDRCAGAVYIPMFGKGRSLNVTSAASVAAYAAIFSSRSSSS